MKNKKVITLQTTELKNVPIGGVFIGDNEDFFKRGRDGFAAYVKTDDWGVAGCSFDDIDGGHIYWYGRGCEEVAYTGVVLNVGNQ